MACFSSSCGDSLVCAESTPALITSTAKRNIALTELYACGAGCYPARGLLTRAVCADCQSPRRLATCPTSPLEVKLHCQLDDAIPKLDRRISERCVGIHRCSSVRARSEIQVSAIGADSNTGKAPDRVIQEIIS